MNNRIQVFIISHQLLLRRGIEHSLSQVNDMKLSGSTGMDEGMLAIMEALPPDVAIVDIDGTNDSGLALARKIKQRLPNIGLIMLTSYISDVQLFQALKAQASAYVDKQIGDAELAEVIRRVSRGEHPINESLTARPKVAEQVLKQFQELTWRNEAEAFISPLTPRETQILNHIAQGLLNKQIAVELAISEQTIKNHVTSILRKLNANARTEAVVIAIKQGLITIA